jgi:hypothetical protein
MSKTIALLLDQSGSMGPYGYGYIEYAKTSAMTFLNIMHHDDSAAVVGFNQAANLVQPVLVLATQSVTNAVCQKILAMQADGNTNIGDAIKMADGQIGGSADVKAMVLLTDGEWNVPPDPMSVLPAYAIYTIALGNSYAIDTMKQIATRTGGTYHFAPGARELQAVYNEIAQDSKVADTVTNELESVNAYGYHEIVTTFSPSVTSGKLAVSWDDTNVKYTAATPVGSQLNISITDPSGHAFTDAPVFMGPSGVVFDIPNPAPGSWIVGCWYAGEVGGRPLGCVWGGFEPYGTAVLSVKQGEGGVDVEFSDDAGPLAQASLRATLETPLMSLEDAAKANAVDANGIQGDAGEEIKPSLASAAAFERRMGQSCVPVSRTPLRAVATESGHHLDLSGANAAGYAVLHLTAEGVSQKTGAKVKRTRRITLMLS